MCSKGLGDFALSKILGISTNTFHQLIMASIYHYCHIPAVNDLLAVEVLDL